MSTCPNCQSTMDATSSFCRHCGAGAYASVAPVGVSSPVAPRSPNSGRRPLTVALSIAAVVALVGAGLAVTMAMKSSQPASATANVVAPAPPSTSTSPSAPSTVVVPSGSNVGAPVSHSVSATPSVSPAASGEAAALAALLAQSSSTRSVVDSTASDIVNCGDGGANEDADAATMTDAASERESLLADLSQLDVSDLPNGSTMVDDLSNAWNASLSSDQDYAAYASDEDYDCTPNDSSDSNYQAAMSDDSASTNAKSSFVALWNEIASTYGQPTYDASSI